MKQIAGWGLMVVSAISLAACTAGAPATVDPAPTSELAAAMAQASATEPPASTAPPTQPAPTIPAATATATSTSEPIPPAVAPTVPAAELAYRAQAEGRPVPPPPPGDGSLLTFNRGPSNRLEVALTFDAGADTGYAADILDLLADYGIKATFGMTGVWAENNPELVLRIANEGHQLMNHTYDHASFTGNSTGAEPQTYESILSQLDRTEQIVRDLTGYEMKPYVRPPYGDIGPMTSGYLADAGYYVNVMWTCDSQGWRGWDAAQIVAYCTTNIGSGEIILLHVGASAPGDFESLPGMIDTFSDLGYSFVTIEQMLQP